LALAYNWTEHFQCAYFASVLSKLFGIATRERRIPVEVDAGVVIAYCSLMTKGADANAKVNILLLEGLIGVDETMEFMDK
jgi:hypothetical protein